MRGGSWYIKAIVDSPNNVAESNEANNTATGNLVTIEKPDLTVESLTAVPTSAATGQAITVADVAAIGSGNACNVRVGYYLSTDSTISKSDLFIGDRLILDLWENTPDS